MPEHTHTSHQPPAPTPAHPDPPQNDQGSQSEPTVAAQAAKLFSEAEEIEMLLLKAAQQHPAPLQPARRTAWLWPATLGVLGIIWVLLPAARLWIEILLLLFFIVTVVVLCRLSVQDWQSRRINALKDLQLVTLREQPLLKALLPCSRAALLHASATARSAEARIANRVTLLLGQNRSGGLLGLILVVLGAIATGKYLEDQRVVIPLIQLAVTPGVVLYLVFTLFAAGAAVLLAGYSVGPLTSSADLLDRAAQLKRNLEEERA